MARHFPVPHQLNAARGCVGKTGLESLWRPRGASAQNTNQSTDTAKQSQGRRARRSSVNGAVNGARVVAIPEPEIRGSAQHQVAGPRAEAQDSVRPEVEKPEIEEPETHGPEVGDEEPTPEIEDSGIPEPDIPEPNVPQPDIPEPEVPEPRGPQPEPPRTE